jgi:ABC-type spermidine/putrescine transport system permease subunit I
MLSIFTSLITLVYYVLVAYVSAILLYNLVKSKSWEKEVLYIVVLIPFLLRLFMLK